MKALILALAMLGAGPASAQDARIIDPPAPAQGVAPAAADKKLGMATMSAVVAGNGTLVNGAGAVSVTKIGTGRYSVEFAREVTGCAYVAMAGNISGNTGTAAVYAIGFYTSDDPNVIRIQMKNPINSFDNDGAFHLIVFCHQ